MRSFVAAFTLAIPLTFAACLPGLASAQSYPSQSIRLVVPFPPGGTNDAMARIVAKQVELQTGQTVVVDNKGGANGIIGIETVVNAPADGYTVLHSSPSVLINEHIYKELRYRTDRDLVPITNIATGTGYLILVRPASPLKTIGDLVAAAKVKPEAVAYGSAGVGNTTHLAAELMSTRVGIEMLHVPYKGIAESMQAAMAGQVEMVLVPPTQALKLVQSGRMRALAFTGEQRWSQLPDVPTLGETVPGFKLIGGWFGWFVPKGSPSAVVTRLHAEVAKALRAPHVKEFIESGGYNTDGRAPPEFAKFLASEGANFAAAVKAAKIQPQ